jgi:hypothetical protein
MTAEELALAASVFFSGLAAGLLGALVTIFRPMQTAMDGREFRGFMEAFLPYARKAWFNYAWSLGMAFAPAVALVLLWDDAGSTSFVLTAVGLGIVLVGIWLVSNVWKEPQYDVILGWDPEDLPADWEQGRQRYFAINLIQCVTTWAALVLFLLALINL